MVLDASLLNIQHYKVQIKGKVEKSRERSRCPPLHLGVVANKKGAFELPSITLLTTYTHTHTHIYIYIYNIYIYIYIYIQGQAK